METCKIVNSVPTKVVCFGKGIDEDLSGITYLVLVFPGNPGIIEYYREFMESIHEGLRESYPTLDIPVWGISHAGHQINDIDHSLFPTLDENIDLYTLDGQIKHKVDFIQTYIPKRIRIIGIGHSIGCKTWEQALGTLSESNACDQLFKCFMLFPTLLHMSLTPNGKKFTPITARQTLVEWCLWPLTVMPTVLQRLLIKYCFLEPNIPESVETASLQLFNYQVFRRSLTMGRCEMEQVNELDVGTLHSHIEKLFFYFGTTDGWCPLQYVDDMKMKLPDMNFKICDKGFRHDFVVHSGVEMAKIICQNVVLSET